MKIILVKDVTGLGEEGEIKEVAGGYARNFLFPQKFASPYNAHALSLLDKKKKAIEKLKEEKRRQAMSLKERLESEELTFTMPAGAGGKLFGSVNNAIIHQELQAKGYSIERKRIEVADHHIRTVGAHTVHVKLYGNEEAALKVTIEASEPDK